MISLRIARARSDLDAQKFHTKSDQSRVTGIAAPSLEGEAETPVNATIIQRKRLGVDRLVDKMTNMGAMCAPSPGMLNGIPR